MDSYMISLSVSLSFHIDSYLGCYRNYSIYIYIYTVIYIYIYISNLSIYIGSIYI